MARNKDKGNNLKIAGVFILLVLGLIILSLFIKAILVIKDSRFDGSHRFTVALVGNKDSKVISFSPANKSISLLNIEGDLSKQSLIDFLQVPIDSVANVKDKKIQNLSIQTSLINYFFDFNQYSKLTVIDSLRLILFARSVSLNSVSEKTISKSASLQERNTIAKAFFQDSAINQENVKIKIINATNTFNLGAKLANILENIGCNVVLVSSAEKISSKSYIIFRDKESYTLKKIISFLAFPKEKSSKPGVADVIIVIGTDSLDKLKF